ncbi:MAG: ABC transporter permease [Waddliaceae bacterium]|nr:ABC transporter permease [Waddliaceae bacterium]
MTSQNPYFGTDFFTFIAVLAQRAWGFLTGSSMELTSDEIQMLVLVGISISGALVGSFLMLRQMSMLANSLSHTVLLGIVLVYLYMSRFSHGDHDHSSSLNVQGFLLASLGMGVITTFLTEFLTKVGKVQEDASNGLVFTSLFALGIILATIFARNAHVGTEAIMGNVHMLHREDLKLVYVICLINAALFLLFYKEYKITTFDAPLASALGISTTFFNYLLMIQVSAVTVGAFRAVGVLMVLALIIGPPLAARRLTNSLGWMLCFAALIGALASIMGVALSRHFLSVEQVALSTGGLVVCCIGFLYLLVIFFAPRTGLLFKFYQMKNLKRVSEK